MSFGVPNSPRLPPGHLPWWVRWAPRCFCSPAFYICLCLFACLLALSAVRWTTPQSLRALVSYGMPVTSTFQRSTVSTPGPHIPTLGFRTVAGHMLLADRHLISRHAQIRFSDACATCVPDPSKSARKNIRTLLAARSRGGTHLHAGTTTCTGTHRRPHTSARSPGTGIHVERNHRCINCSSTGDHLGSIPHRLCPTWVRCTWHCIHVFFIVWVPKFQFPRGVCLAMI